MKLSAKSGATIAAAAAALMLGGSVAAPTAAVAQDKVKCFGVNSCKGHGACKTASNECKGQNACKGQGFLRLTEAECEERGGTTEPQES